MIEVILLYFTALVTNNTVTLERHYDTRIYVSLAIICLSGTAISTSKHRHTTRKSVDFGYSDNLRPSVYERGAYKAVFRLSD